ncbi:MAG: hypothetical protein M1113_05890 [Candidatus Thermoplasmatota archaeon]|nr:hypothetical protein [Candidatus Thermoplasmatota archaeon]
MDREYIAVNTVYFSQAFIFLLAGLILYLLRGAIGLHIVGGSVSMLWLFGFVVSMIFGITNIMIPSYAGRVLFNHDIIKVEIIMLDLGVTLLMVGLNVTALRIIFIPAVFFLLISVLIHTYNMISVGSREKLEGVHETGHRTTDRR